MSQRTLPLKNKYLNTNSNRNLDIFKQDYDISGLNFKSLANLNSKNKMSSVTLPNNNNSYIENNFAINNLSDDNINLNIEEISDVHTLKIIINNLELELRERRDEIKELKRNFKEKIVLMEQENKKSYDQIEIKHKIEVNNIIQNNKDMTVEVENLHLSNKGKYEELVMKVIREYNTVKNTTIPLAMHNMKVNELNYRWKENFEKIKSLFHNKIKDIVKSFDSPEYVYLLERIQFINSNANNENKNLINILNKDFNTDEYTVTLDKIKLKIMEVSADYIKAITEIEVNYENNFNSARRDVKDKLEELKDYVNKRFDKIEMLKTFVEEGFKQLDDVNAGNKVNIRGNVVLMTNIHQNIGENANNPNNHNNSLRESIPSNKKEEEGQLVNLVQFNSSLLKNALGSGSGTPLSKDNFNTFKNISVDSLVNVDNGDELFEGIGYKHKFSNVSVSEDMNILVSDEADNIHRPSKILSKQYNLEDFNK